MGLRHAWLLAASLLGCGAPTDDEPEAALPEFAAADVPPAQGATTDPLQARRAYLTQWSRCLLRTRARLDESWTRLQQDIDITKVRVRKRGLQPYFDSLDDGLLDSCPLGTQPPPDVDPALATEGRAYVLAARGYGNRAGELRTYFDTEGYVSDDWETLRQDLPGLKDAHTAASEAAATFATSLRTAQDDADQAWLTALQAEGASASASWHVTHTARVARAVEPCATTSRPVPEACALARASLAEARAGLEAWRAGNPADAVGVFWLDVFRNRTDALERALAGLDAPVSRRKSLATTQLAETRDTIALARDAVQTAANTVVFDFP